MISMQHRDGSLGRSAPRPRIERRPTANSTKVPLLDSVAPFESGIAIFRDRDMQIHHEKNLTMAGGFAYVALLGGEHSALMPSWASG